MKGVAWAIGSYALLLVCVYFVQRDLLYHPSAERVPPAAIGLDEFDEVLLTLADGSKTISWYAAAETGQRTLLFLHGNAGSIRYRARPLREFRALGYGVFILGYPGYGGSGGSPSEQALVSAALKAYDFLAQEPAADRIFVFGQSLGSAVAVQLAAERPVAALALAAPMSSIRDEAQRRFRWVPVDWVIRDPFLSDEKVGLVDAPLLIVHGTEDRVIPIESGRRLFAAARQPKEFQQIKGAAHNNLYDYELTRRVHEFYSRH